MPEPDIPLQDPGAPGTAREVPCFQCGVCCLKWQPLLSPAELRELAASLGLTLRTFNRRYTRTYPVRRGYRQLRTGDTGGCVFLQPLAQGSPEPCRRAPSGAQASRLPVPGETPGTLLYACSIYENRPQVCRDWKAGLDKRECLEGIRRLALPLRDLYHDLRDRAAVETAAGVPSPLAGEG